MHERHGSNSPSLLTAFQFLCYPAIPKIRAEVMQFFCENLCKMLQAALSRLKNGLKIYGLVGKGLCCRCRPSSVRHSTLTHAAVARDASARSPCGPRAPPSPEILEQVKSRYVLLSGGARWAMAATVESHAWPAPCPAISFPPCHRHPSRRKKLTNAMAGNQSKTDSGDQ